MNEFGIVRWAVYVLVAGICWVIGCAVGQWIVGFLRGFGPK